MSEPQLPHEDQPLIRNCRFAFRCHQAWQSLDTTDNPTVRYCHECSREVVLCRRDDELRAALADNHCVAIEHPKPGPVLHTVGVVIQGGWE